MNANERTSHNARTSCGRAEKLHTTKDTYEIMSANYIEYGYVAIYIYGGCVGGFYI